MILLSLILGDNLATKSFFLCIYIFCLYNYNISHDISFSSLQVNPKSGIPGISPDLHQQLTRWNSKVGRIKETCLHGNLGGHSTGVQDTLDDPQGHRYLDETCSVRVCSDATFATSASLVFPLCFTPPPKKKKSHCVTSWLVPYLLIFTNYGPFDLAFSTKWPSS